MTYKHFNNEATRASLIGAVADTGNSAAWNRLFDLYAGFIFSIARSKGLNEDAADEVVLSVFGDLARKLPGFEYDRTKGKFRSFLIRLTHWRITDKLRSIKRDADLKDAFSSEYPTLSSGDTNFAEREWQMAAMEAGLRRMKSDVKPEHFAAFVALKEGQDVETVMQLYGLSRDNLYQIRKRLTAKLSEAVKLVLFEMDNPAV